MGKKADFCQELQDALVELQSAAWSRSWKRVKAARARVKEITGLDVPGPLTHALDAHSKALNDELVAIQSVVSPAVEHLSRWIAEQERKRSTDGR